MPSFQQMLDERTSPKKEVQKRRGLIAAIQGITDRPLIIYAADIAKSHPAVPNLIYPLDKTAIAELIEPIPQNEKNLDILLQSPGGFLEPTEMIVGLIRRRFESVHFFIPHTAKSAATVMALSGNKIYMDNRSELGPIDPQIRVPKLPGGSITVPAQAYLDGFRDVIEKLKKEGGSLPAGYLPILNQVDVATLELCRTSQEHARRLAAQWLESYMFAGRPDAAEKAKSIAHELSDYREFLSHGRPIGLDKALQMRLVVEDLATTPKLRNLVWQLYCRIELHFDRSPFIKLYESETFSFGKRVPREQVIQIPLPGLPVPKKETKRAKRKKPKRK